MPNFYWKLPTFPYPAPLVSVKKSLIGHQLQTSQPRLTSQLVLSHPPGNISTEEAVHALQAGNSRILGMQGRWARKGGQLDGLIPGIPKTLCSLGVRVESWAAWGSTGHASLQAQSSTAKQGLCPDNSQMFCQLNHYKYKLVHKNPKKSL